MAMVIEAQYIVNLYDPSELKYFPLVECELHIYSNIQR